MRLRITLRDDIVRRVDLRVGARRRSAYIAAAVERALADDRRWELLEAAIGSTADGGHDWDDDPGQWVRHQRWLAAPLDDAEQTIGAIADWGPAEDWSDWADKVR